MGKLYFLAGWVLLATATASAQVATAPATNPVAFNPNPNALPSTADVQQMLDDKKYQQVIQQTSRLLALKGPAAEPYNHFDLLRLKAEAQLQHGETSAAVSTFTDLGRQTNDPEERDVVQATLLLIRRSPHGKYVPKTVAPGKDKAEPIDIQDPVTRKTAFEALFNDEQKAIEPRLKSAMASQTISPILPMIESILSLRALDVAASGTDQRTTELTSKLLDHARKLLTAALDQMGKREDAISQSANTETVNTQIVTMKGMAVPVQSRLKQGLSDQNIRELKDMIDTCKKITPAAESMAKIASPDADMQDVLKTTDQVRSKATDLLNTNFSSSIGAPTIGQ